jgi:hypothetical protein
MTAESPPIRGSCLCGAVAYEVRPPFEFFKYCHCRRCRKNSGGAHAANLLVDVRQFAWTHGEDSVRRFELPGARAFCTGFCNRCGSALPWLTKNGTWMLIPAGGLDDAPGMLPDKNVFWDSRAAWYVAADSLPCFAEEG